MENGKEPVMQLENNGDLNVKRPYSGLENNCSQGNLTTEAELPEDETLKKIKTNDHEGIIEP